MRGSKWMNHWRTVLTFLAPWDVCEEPVSAYISTQPGPRQKFNSIALWTRTAKGYPWLSRSGCVIWGQVSRSDKNSIKIDSKAYPSYTQLQISGVDLRDTISYHPLRTLRCAIVLFFIIIYTVMTVNAIIIIMFKITIITLSHILPSHEQKMYLLCSMLRHGVLQN
jgi:hypothetical protein